MLGTPDHPKTVIVKVKTNEYDISYAHGKPMYSFTVDTCPDSIFNYNSDYYQSIISLKNNFLTAINHIKFKLEAFDQQLLDEYIASRSQSLREKYISSINNNISKLQDMNDPSFVDSMSPTHKWSESERIQFETDVESEILEQESILSTVDETIRQELYNQWFYEHGTTPNSMSKLQSDLCEKEIGFRSLDDEILEWKKQALREAIDFENIVITEYTSIPHVQEEFDEQFNNLYLDLMSSHSTDVKNSCFDVIYHKFPKHVTDKYGSHLNSMIFMHGKNKCHKNIDTYMSVVKDRIVSIMSCLHTDAFECVDWYELKKYIFPVLSKTVDMHARMLFQYLNDRLKRIDIEINGNVTMDALRKIATTVVMNINSSLSDFHLIMSKITDSGFIELKEVISNSNEAYIE